MRENSKVLRPAGKKTGDALIDLGFPSKMRQGLYIILVWGLVALLATSVVHAQDKSLVTAGEFSKIYDPSVGENERWYINDHCFVHGKDGLWHMFGITHAEPAKPLDEKHFAHATASSLTQTPWRKLPFALSADEARQETILWAPYVILHKKTYYMFYVAGGSDNTKHKIHLATSSDLKSWKPHRQNPMVVDGYDARDPFILRIRGRWIMYYTANTEPAGGNHIVAYRTSKNLVKWGDRHIAFTDPTVGTFGGPTESPFVVQRGKFYYLFIGPRGDYVGTDIFRSQNPLQWKLADKVGHIKSHAAEVVRDTDGQWYVSRSGWGQGGLYLAPLIWNDGLDDSVTSLPPAK
jgi:arabinan endo-1,5-alpha-L-arabinosidase